MSQRPSSGSEGPTTPPPRRTKNVANVVCWEEARLRQNLPRIIGRCMSYSAANCFDDALVAAVRSFYGIEVDVATAETDILEDDFERVRFFPWFLWDFALPGTSSVGERFLAEGELNELERDIVRALTRSSVSFVAITETRPESGFIVLRDLGARAAPTAIVIRDQALATELQAGQIALLRLVDVPRASLPADLEGSLAEARPSTDLDVVTLHATFAMLDAIYAVLPPEARPLVEAELTQLVDGLDGAATTALMKEKAPELLDFAEHVLHKLTEPPTIVNIDDEPIVLCRTLVAMAGDAHGLLAACGLAPAARDASAPWVWDEGGRMVGWLRPVPGSAGGWVAEASSRERFARLKGALGRMAIELPTLHSEIELARAVAQWLAMGECEAWLTDPEVELAFRGQLGDSLNQWPDLPHPALGRRTPREVQGEPGGDAVVARLLQRVRKVAGDAAGARLATLLA